MFKSGRESILTEKFIQILIDKYEYDEFISHFSEIQNTVQPDYKSIKPGLSQKI